MEIFPIPNLEISEINPDWESVFSGDHQKISRLPTQEESIISEKIGKISSSKVQVSFTNVETQATNQPLGDLLEDLTEKLEFSLQMPLNQSFQLRKRKNSVGLPLKLFIDIPKRSKKHNSKGNKRQRIEPKCEYVRIKLIRGFKRALRCVFLFKVPLKTINKLNLNDADQKACWEIFKEFVMENKTILDEISKTTNGPDTDGESIKKQIHGPDFKNTLKNEKTWNNTICKQFFFQFYSKTHLLFIFRCPVF